MQTYVKRILPRREMEEKLSKSLTNQPKLNFQIKSRSTDVLLCSDNLLSKCEHQILSLEILGEKEFILKVQLRLLNDCGLATEAHYFSKIVDMGPFSTKEYDLSLLLVEISLSENLLKIDQFYQKFINCFQEQ